MESLSFHRPKWMIKANLAAGLLFLIAGIVTFLAGRLGIPILWWLIAIFWFRRYSWAKEIPFLEISDEALTLHLGPNRAHSLPWSKIQAAEGDEQRVEVRLDDGSGLTFKASDLEKGELPRFLAALRRNLPIG